MGCLRGAFTLVLLAIIVVVLWFQRDRLIVIWHDVQGTRRETVAVASPELARTAQARLQRLANGDTTSVALTSAELESLVRYEYADLLPSFVDSARASVDDNQLHLSARIPTDRIPLVERAGEMAQLLPDTADIRISGQLIPLSGDRIGFAVDGVHAERVPLPKTLVPGILKSLGRRNEPGLPPEAIALPLPPGVRAAYVRGDSLILLAREERLRPN
jgi:hypothetical protein